MKISRISILACFCALTMVIPAFAGVTVNEPSNNSNVSSTFTLSASASVCGGVNVDSMGYSFDSSTNTTVFYKQSIDTSISSSSGAHVLKVKAFGKGVSCVADVAINVQAGSSSSSTSGIVPSYATTVGHIQALSGWQAKHDSGGSGSASGSTAVVSSPSLYGSTRSYVTYFTNGGDERYSTTFADDVNAKNFFYDTWVYLTSSSSQLGNLEFDVNQVMANGQTVLVGMQCDGYTGHWAYTLNTGSSTNVIPRWYSKSGTSCNPRSWSQYKWHHVQYSFSRDDSGYIRYHAVWLDGVETSLGITAFGAASLGWAPIINTQFQVDGYGSSGHVTAYLDNLTISRW